MIFSAFSGVGRGIFTIIILWVIHYQYQNPFYTGLAGFMLAVMTIGSFLVGPFVDRHNKANLLRADCLISLIVVCLTLIAFLTYLPGVWFLLLMTLIKAATELIGNPARTAILPRIVDGEDLMKANALKNIVNIIAGLGFGGFLYVAMSRGGDFALVFAVSATLLLVALIFAIFIKSNEVEKTELKTDKTPIKAYFSELKEGFTFVKSGVLMFLLVAVLAMDIAASVAYVNLPMFAQVHTGQASGYIILTFLAMIGGLIGSYISRIIGPKLEIWKVLLVSFVLAGAARILFVNVIADNFTRALLIYAFYVGMGSVIGMFFGTLIQKLPPKRLIARVDTIFDSLLGVTSAFGALLGGIMGTLIVDVDLIFIIQGVTYIVIGLLVCMSKSVRGLPKIDDVKTFEDGQ